MGDRFKAVIFSRLLNKAGDCLAIGVFSIPNKTALSTESGFVSYGVVRNQSTETSYFNLIEISTKQFSQDLTYSTDLDSKADLTVSAIYIHSTSNEPLYLSLQTIQNYLVYLPTEKLDSYAGYGAVAQIGVEDGISPIPSGFMQRPS